MGDEREQRQARRPGETAEFLARELGGSLPCARCRYDLRGLSVRASCPECRIPVRATIRLKVDPLARELRPIRFPRLTVIGLLTWVWAALAAALAIWVLRANDLVAAFDIDAEKLRWVASHASRAVPVLILISGLGAVHLIRPHDGIPTWQVCAAVGGICAYGALAAVCWRIHVVHDPSPAPLFVSTGGQDSTRSILRLAADALIAAAVLLVRPNARLLVARSMLLRSGKVDRQTMLAMAATMVVVAAGDALHLGAMHLPEGKADLANIAGTAFIGIGSLLFTMGLVGMVVDSHRISPVVMSPPLALGDVLAPARERAT